RDVELLDDAADRTGDGDVADSGELGQRGVFGSNRELIGDEGETAHDLRDYPPLAVDHYRPGVSGFEAQVLIGLRVPLVIVLVAGDKLRPGQDDELVEHRERTLRLHFLR